jgi:hypothetical protein
MPQTLVDEANGLIAKRRNKAVDLESELWGQPVEKYTGMVSKDPQARLALIASYPEELANKYELSYAAGLWSGSLVADLLWYVDGTPTSRPSDYCAPSWSWVSVTGAVTCVPSSELIDTSYVTIKEIHTNLLNQDISTGAVVGGYVRLHGCLIEIPRPTFFNICGHHVAGYFYPDDPNDITERRYFCLPVQRQLTPRGPWLCGLLLHKMEYHWGVEYRRVGLFRCIQGDSLHVLGQKVRGKADSTFYSYETYLETGIDGNPKPAEITII